jgi:hypothetical protein
MAVGRLDYQSTVHGADVILRHGITLVGSLAIPPQRFSIVPHYAMAKVAQFSEMPLYFPLSWDDHVVTPKIPAWRYLRRYAEPLLEKLPKESELCVSISSMVR